MMRFGFSYGAGRPTPLGSAPAAPAAQAASLFETPVIVDHMPQAAALNADLGARILARRADHPGLAISNEGGWHSDRAMLEWGGDGARRLADRILATVAAFTTDIKQTGAPRHRWYPEMWANVSPPGAANRHHCHPGAFWSAVYYVDDGYGGSDDPALGGELVLYDPRMPMVRMLAPDLRFVRPGQPPDHDENRMRPASGRIVIFPGWLNHSVAPYRGTGLRISVAMNLSPIPAAAQPG
jgi:uncharacterized protein (TIGR02466 family)